MFLVLFFISSPWFYILQIVLEKEKFKKNPFNYAIKKTLLLKQKELAEVEGDDERLKDVTSQLETLEERAVELDRRRTSNISSVK